MEILRLPDGAKHLEIPDLGGPDFDCGDFMSFDKRCGIDIDAILRDPIRHLKEPYPDNTVTFGQCMQSWFFLGTLSVYLGRHIPRETVSRFAKSCDGRVSSCLNTEQLIGELDTFDTVYRSFNLREKSVWKDQVNSALIMAADALGKLTSLPLGLRSALICPEVHLHLAIHYHLLDHSIWQLLSGSESLSISLGGLFDFKPLFTQRGLCPNLAERLAPVGCAGLYYALQLPNLTSQNFSHTSCTHLVCTAMQVDSRLYKTAHRRSCCDCFFAAYDVPHVVSLIQKHEVPVVQFHQDPVRSWLSYMPASQCDYIAISHVWADGLGNPSANTLPECQLALLRSWVSDLYDELGGEGECGFWMDTVCIPTDSIEARWTAIQDMHKVYNKALAVLVISQDLYSVSAPAECEEALVRIASSSWMTRLWTLQEGILAERLFFQFADIALEYSELRETAVQQESGHDLVKLIGHDSTSEFDRASLCYRNGQYQFPLPLLWESLRFRTTSRMTDAPLVVGRLMGLDISRLSQDGEDQMKSFWEIQETLPLSVLWLSGPKMSLPGLRWAPASLVDPEALSCRHDPIAVPAKYTREGLEVTDLVAYSLKDVWLPHPEHEDAAFTFTTSNTDGIFCLRDPDTGRAKTWRSTNFHRLSGRS